jgi:hypothetical protein
MYKEAAVASVLLVTGMLCGAVGLLVALKPECLPASLRPTIQSDLAEYDGAIDRARTALIGLPIALIGVLMTWIGLALL